MIKRPQLREKRVCRYLKMSASGISADSFEISQLREREIHLYWFCIFCA